MLVRPIPSRQGTPEHKWPLVIDSPSHEGLAYGHQKRTDQSQSKYKGNKG